MSSKKLPRLVVFGDSRKPEVASAISNFKAFAADKGEVLAVARIDECTGEMLEAADYALVFGGDGTIISAGRALSESKVPVVGVNLGKLGFLAEFNVAELREYFEKIISGQAPIEHRMMLCGEVYEKGSLGFSSSVINDVFITAGRPFRAIELMISVNGESLAGCVSDGLIISTPTGSTAYNLSAGGPIISGKVPAIVITPICAHSLSFRPIVLSEDSEVEIRAVRVNKGTTVSFDGQVSCGFSVGQELKLRKHSGKFLVVNNPVRTQWETLATKLRWAQKPKYNSR